MASPSELRAKLSGIDGRGYKAYKSITGSYRFPGFSLRIDHVQGDPFAAPSRVRVVVDTADLGLPGWAYATPVRRVTTGDWLLRRVGRATREERSRRGSGKSGLLAVDEPGQEVLARTGAVIDEEALEVRMVVGLPAAGRRVLGDEAIELLCDDIPRVVDVALTFRPNEFDDLRLHLETVEDQVHLREALPAAGLVAFVGDGSVLPRRSGVSDLPLPDQAAVRFESPPSLAVELDAPHAGRVRGMGIPAGVTLIVGGGYHGKSTLLAALARGVYDHVPGDGRELVVTDPAATKIRAEDGRRVEAVDISPFISRLPTGADTGSFRTENASGSTSQAANIVEALELGAGVLLIDEDTSATNFMIRDRRMQLLVEKAAEPITPFVDLVGRLHSDLGISTILVMGGSGDYLDVADTVIQMEGFHPQDVTARAREVAAEFPTGRQPEAPREVRLPAPRIPDPSSIDSTRGRKVKIRERGVNAIEFGDSEIDLGAVEQLVDPSQTRAVGRLLDRLARRYLDSRTPLPAAITLALAEVEKEGLDVLSPFAEPVGDLALPRPQEVGAALNRLRTLRVSRQEE